VREANQVDMVTAQFPDLQKGVLCSIEALSCFLSGLHKKNCRRALQRGKTLPNFYIRMFIGIEECDGREVSAGRLRQKEPWSSRDQGLERQLGREPILLCLVRQLGGRLRQLRFRAACVSFCCQIARASRLME